MYGMAISSMSSFPKSPYPALKTGLVALVFCFATKQRSGKRAYLETGRSIMNIEKRVKTQEAHIVDR